MSHRCGIRRKGWCRLALAGLLLLASGLPASPARAGRKAAKSWVGQPVSALTAVLGAPDRIQEGKRKDLHIWYRYPLTGLDDLRQATDPVRDMDPGADTDPPPIPGDPTRQPPRVIECTARVGAGGLIVGVSMPEACQVPPFGATGSGRPELPHGDAPPRPELPRSSGGAEKRPPA